MKKAIIVSALLLITPTANAGEVTGTRVSGDVAINCPAGSGRGIEMNVTTKEVWSYCVEIERPTQEQITQRVTETVPQVLTTQKNANAPKVQSDTTIVNDPVVDLTGPRPIKVDVNATTQVVTISELTDEEITENAKWAAVSKAQETAQNQSRTQANDKPGTEFCTKWQSGSESGEECHLKPIEATQEEVDTWLTTWKEVMAVIGWDWWL